MLKRHETSGAWKIKEQQYSSSRKILMEHGFPFTTSFLRIESCCLWKDGPPQQTRHVVLQPSDDDPYLIPKDLQGTTLTTPNVQSVLTEISGKRRVER